jgi:hypothetical protein
MPNDRLKAKRLSARPCLKFVIAKNVVLIHLMRPGIVYPQVFMALGMPIGN